jgi:anti-sigma-K factor RskA
MNLEFPQGRSVAAGEYVMGTLTPDERFTLEATLLTDRELQAEVYRWQDKLLTLALRIGPIEPDAGTWEGITARIDRPLPTAGLGPAGSATPAANDAHWRSLRLWQTISGLATAACLVLAVMWVNRVPAPGAAPAERYLTLLQSPDKSTGWVVEVTPARTLRLVPIGPVDAVPPGKSLQFWTKLDGAAGPTSLGLVKPGQVVELPLARLPGVAERQLFELTLEPEAGSPLDRPSGPILYVGRSVRL